MLTLESILSAPALTNVMIIFLTQFLRTFETAVDVFYGCFKNLAALQSDLGRLVPVCCSPLPAYQKNWVMECNELNHAEKAFQRGL